MKLQIYTLLFSLVLVVTCHASTKTEVDYSVKIDKNTTIQLEPKKRVTDLDPKLIELERQWIVELVKKRADAFTAFNLKEDRIESTHRMLGSGSSIQHTLKLKIPEEKEEEFLAWMMGIRINPVSKDSMLWSEGFNFEVIKTELVFTLR